MSTLTLRGDIALLLWSTRSPDAGDPTCLCSACGRWIPEDCIPVRLFDERKSLEARFCDRCAAEWLGLQTLPDPDPTDPY